MKSRICGLLVPQGAASLPPPSILSYSAGGTGAVCGGDTITFTVQNAFGPLADVSITINGVPCTNISHSADSRDTWFIRCTTPMGAAHGVAYDIVLTTTSGSVTLPASWTYSPSPLTCSACVPPSGPDGGSVTIPGTGFLDVTDVSGNGFTLSAWAIVDDRTITATHDPEGPPPPYDASIAITNGVDTVFPAYAVTS